MGRSGVSHRLSTSYTPLWTRRPKEFRIEYQIVEWVNSVVFTEDKFIYLFVYVVCLFVYIFWFRVNLFYDAIYENIDFYTANHVAIVLTWRK